MSLEEGFNPIGPAHTRFQKQTHVLWMEVFHRCAERCSEVRGSKRTGVAQHPSQDRRGHNGRQLREHRYPSPSIGPPHLMDRGTRCHERAQHLFLEVGRRTSPEQSNTINALRHPLKPGGTEDAPGERPGGPRTRPPAPQDLRRPAADRGRAGPPGGADGASPGVLFQPPAGTSRATPSSRPAP